MFLPEALVSSGLVVSGGEARRYIVQGAIRVNGELVRDPDYKLKTGNTYVLRVGKRKCKTVHLDDNGVLQEDNTFPTFEEFNEWWDAKRSDSKLKDAFQMILSERSKLNDEYND